MKSSSKKKYIIVLCVVVVALGIIAWLRIHQNALDAAAVKRPAPVVESSKPMREHLTDALTFTGDVLPIVQANIFSRVTGNVEQVYVDLGSRVQKGQLLALIDTTMFAQTVRQNASQWRQAVAAFDNAKLVRDRTTTLLEKKLVSKQEMDNTDMAFNVAQAQADAAQAAYHNAATQLTYCRITAPFAGFITKRYLDPGAYVNNVPTAQGSTLFTLMDTDTLKIYVNVLDRDIERIPSVHSALVHADALHDTVFTASVRRTGQAIDLATRTFPVEIDIPNHEHIMKPGMFATTQLVLRELDDALTVPADAVVTLENISSVFTLSSDSLAHRHTVKTGISAPGRMQITEGIGDSDRIVVQGQQLLKDGMKVRIAK